MPKGLGSLWAVSKTTSFMNALTRARKALYHFQRTIFGITIALLLSFLLLPIYGIATETDAQSGSISLVTTNPTCHGSSDGSIEVVGIPPQHRQLHTTS